MSDRKKYCSNCNKFGHYIKECKLPLTSIGLLCLKFDKKLSISADLINEFISSDKYKEINNFNFHRTQNINKIDFYKDKIYFLLICRKHSLNYVDFIRGLYNLNDEEKLIKIFNLMSNDEINKIKINKNNFDKLWFDMWKTTANNKQYISEYKKSKQKFTELVKKNIFIELVNIQSEFDSPEWEIPKGRKNSFETNLNCAIREIKEETRLTPNDYKLISNMFSIHDTFKGTNNVLYKHVYYLAIANSDNKLDKISINNNEVSKIGWFNWVDTINLIRPYYESKIELLNKIFLFILNINEELKNETIIKEY